MKLIIRLKKRKKPIPEFEQLAKAKDEFIKNLFLFIEITKLRIQFGLILATSAKQIKKMKLRQIIKEVKILKAKMEE